MTEKRFEYYNHKGADYILDTPNKSLDFIEMLGDCLEAEEIVDLLNGLNDENKQLQTKNNAYLQDIEVYKEDNTHLKLENEKLKKEIESWKKHCITHGIAVPITWGDKND